MATLTYGPGAGAIDETQAPLTELLFGQFIGQLVLESQSSTTLAFRDLSTGYRLLLSGTYAYSTVDGSLLPFNSFITGIEVRNASNQLFASIPGLQSRSFGSWGGVTDQQFLSILDQEVLTIDGNDFANVLTASGNSRTLNGNGGNDWLLGDWQPNRLDGGEGADTLNGGDGGDTLIGGAGNDLLDGGSGSDYMEGGPGDDTFVGSIGADTIVGGDGTDRADYSAYTGPVALRFEGVEEFFGTAFNDSLYGFAGPELLVGNGGDDLLVGGGGADDVRGGPGNDTLVGGGLGETLAGGAGDDVYELAPGATTFGNIVELAGEGIDVIRVGVSFTLPAEVEQLTLTGSAAIDGWGNALANFVTGNSAGNGLVGLAGDDTLSGQDGNDTLWGDDPSVEAVAGNDLLQGGAGHDLIYGGRGHDVLSGGSGNDTLVPGAGDDSITGGDGIDRVDFSGLPGPVQVDQVAGTASGAGGNDTFGDAIEEVFGSSFDDVLSGRAGAELLAGGDGNDRLIGNGGADDLRGGSGNDTLSAFGGVAVRLAGGAGNDVYEINSASLGSTYYTLSWAQDPTRSADLSMGSFFIDPIGLASMGVLTAVRANFSSPAFPLLGAQFTFGTGVLGPALAQGTTYTQANAFPTTSSPQLSVQVIGVDSFFAHGTGGSFTVDELVIDSSGAVPALLRLAIRFDLNHLNGQFGYLPGEYSGSFGWNASVPLVSPVQPLLNVDLVELPGEGIDTLRSAATVALPATAAAEIENLTLIGTRAINGTGNALDNTLVGNPAANRLAGLAGNDTLDGGEGADEMSGGSGDDLFVVENVADAVTELPGEGTDTVLASVSYALSAGSEIENLILTGNAADATGNDYANTIVGTAANNTIRGGGGFDTLGGGDGNDTIYGDAGEDRLYGERGDDVLLGGDDYDLIFGGEGVDIIVGQGGGDIVFAQSGNDLVDGGAGTDVLFGQEDNDIIFGDAADDQIIGGEGNDIIMGERGGVTLTGGNDIIYGDTEFLSLIGGNDQLDGDGGNDYIIGGGGNDVIDGDNGNDLIEGNAGADILVGSDASLAGAATTGNDLFIYRAMTDAGDTIYGFDIRPGDSDGIDLRPLFDALGYAGTTARADGYLRISQSGANALVQIDADGAANGASFTTMITLVDRTAGTITDGFFLVQ